MNLTVGGLPAGVTATLSPTSVTAGGSSTLSVATTAASVSRTDRIVVSGTDRIVVDGASPRPVRRWSSL
ncbi:hypothetical protein AB0M38_07160 [Streptomyces sp. NPDC051742]|uniref:hypothetical protein n=1 Tax=unclassified Streptomyces TaxID=2593676 RepID=UPI00343A3277